MRKHPALSYVSTGACVVAALTALSCGKPDYTKVPLADLYRSAMTKMESGDEDDAREMFLYIQARSGEMADEAVYRIGETYFRQKLYDDAYDEFDKLINRYPASTWCDNAQYMMGMCRLEAALGPEKDPTYIEEAADEFLTLIEEYEGSNLADDATAKIYECRRRLAEKDLLVAKYYKKNRKYEAAIIYLETIQKNYGDMDLTPEAIFLEAECYHKLKDVENARFLYEKLTRDHPDTAFGTKAAKRLAELSG